MFDKRLFSLAPGVKRLVAAKVFCLWINLLASILFAFALVSLVGVLVEVPQEGAFHALLVRDGSLWPPAVVGYYLLIFACVGVVKYLCSRSSARFGTLAAEKVKLELRERLYNKMLRLGPSYGQFVRSSDVVQSAGEGIDQIQSFFELFLPQLFFAVLAPLTLFCFLAPINWPTALVLLICAPLIVIIVGLVAMRASKMFKKYWGKYTDMGAAFLDDVQGLETLKNFDADERAALDMDKHAEEFRVMTMNVLQIQLRSLTAMDVVAYGGAAAGIAVAVWQYLRVPGRAVLNGFGSVSIFTDGPITAAGVLLVILLAVEFFLPLRQLGSFFHVAMNGMTSTKRIFALLDVPEPKRGDLVLPADVDGIGVEIEDVNFAYPSLEEDGVNKANPVKALKNVNFEAKAHSLTAIVGESGSGKSTIAQCIAGSLQDYQGSISLVIPEGDSAQTVALKDLSGEALAEAVTLVPARSHLFGGTIRENLLMAKPDASDDELMEALAKAHVDDFVEEVGLDYVVEQGAGNLSGGQLQRIAIARALLHDSPIMIFDEATSSVDVESETLIMETIRDLAEQKTVLMITHRLANAVQADLVVVFDRGTVCETGTHQELMQAGGTYSRMFEMQAKVEEVGKRKKHADIRFAKSSGKPQSSGSAEPVQVESASQAEQLSNWQVVRRLLREAGPMRGIMIAASVCGSLGHLAATFLPLFAVMALLAVQGTRVWGMSVGVALICMAACALLRGAMRYCEQFMNHNLAFRLLALFRHKTFAALRKLAPAKLDGKGKGDLISLVTSDVELLEIFFAHTISPVVIALCTSLIYALCLLFLSPWMALLLIVAHVVVGVLLPKVFASALRGVGGVIRKQSAELDDRVLDDMSGIGTIMHLGVGDLRLADVMSRSRALRAERLKLSLENGRFSGIGNVVVVMFSVAAAFVCIGASVGGSWIAGAVAAFVLLVSSFGPTLALSALPANLTQTFAAARRLFALMDEEPAVEETGTASVSYEGMEMRRVSFAYPDAQGSEVLSDYSMRVPVQGILGLQGPSGQGKSTMLKLLMRYWDPQRGAVSMSGVSLPLIDQHCRKRKEILMGQESYLFDGSIAENLRIAKADASDSELEEALKKAAILDLVSSLPTGMETPVGELGGRLSEGEKQRIALARIFLRDADLVLFDEPTSRLDALSEAYILQSINQMVEERGNAVVLVSHRPSTMRICDSIDYI